MKKVVGTIIILLAVFAIALFLRVYFCYNTVFSEPIKYSSDDGVYHMRLVENELLGGHFPNRIYFDPYTNFPNGTYIHFAPLYDQILAGVIWLAGFGYPTISLINKISPFYPAVMGSLIIFLVYFIGKKIWNRKIGIFSAFLIAVSPPYLVRSLLGNTDHHVAEVFFSTLAMMFLFFLMEYSKKKIGLSELLKNKKFLALNFLTALSFGLYFLVWNGAIIFIFIISLFFVLYYLITYFSKNYSEWVLLSGSFISLAVLLMILPFMGLPDFSNARIYGIQHLVSLGLSFFGLLFIAILGYVLRLKKIKPYFLAIFLIAAVLLFFAILKIFFPSFLEAIIKMAEMANIGMTDNKFAREFIGEMSPLRIRGAFGSYSALFYISLFSLLIVFYKFIKEKQPKYFLLFIWTLFMLIIAGIFPSVGQQRFSVYLAVGISLLASFLIVSGFKFGWQGLRKSRDFPKNSYLRFYFSATSLLVIFNVIFFLLFPFPFNIDNAPYPENLPWLMKEVIAAAKSPFVVEEDWYGTFKWLKENTPDPGVDYYALYQNPGINKETGKSYPYVYPPQAYGILAQWSIGHMITYYSHRIPVANPFQQGIGIKKEGKVLELGEGVFFLETEEEKAIQYLEELKAKYVIVNPLLADPNGNFKGYVKWVQGDLEGYIDDETVPNKYDKAMSTRLFFLDGAGATFKTKKEDKEDKENKDIEFSLDSLDHFRLVYESKNSVFLTFKEGYYSFNMVKVFEYVKGARITGKIKSKGKAIISTEIETNQGRKFIYQKETQAENGVFEFIVPYSTFGKDGRIPTETQFAVFAKPYKIIVAGKEFNINVTEEDVLNGKEIKLF